MINVTTAQPTEGQFVAVWEYNGVLWSDTYKWEDGKLYVYTPDAEDCEDEWTLMRHGLKLSPHQNLWHYITK